MMPSIFRKSRVRNGNALTTSQRKNTIRVRNARSGTRAGFPVLNPFESIDDVRTYLSGSSITCLICGNEKRGLGFHVKVHGMTADDYKIKYGIPLQYGLICIEIFEKKQKLGLELVERGDGIHGMSKDERAEASQKGGAALKATGGRKSALSIKEATQRVQKYDDADYWLVPGTMTERDITLSEVLRMGVCGPSGTMIMLKMKRCPDFKKAMLDARQALSFEAKRRGCDIGPEFTETLRQMRESGMSYQNIAAATGVTAMTVHHRLNPKS